MAGGKETPRQKMIGLMYLVLIAMLALNVSAKVLDAFILVEQGLSQTSRSFTMKNDRLYNQMETAYTVNPVRLAPWKEKTDEIKRRTTELNDYLQELKIETILIAEGEDTPAYDPETKEIDIQKITNKGDTHIAGNIFIGTEHGGKAYDLKEKIIDYREFMLSMIDPEIAEKLVESINNILSTEDPPPSKQGAAHTWETSRFSDIPVAAVYPQITKMQLDLLNVEADVVAYLLNQVDAGDFKVNKLDAVVIPSSVYVIQGNEFSADIFLAASDTTQVPRIYIGNYESFTTEQGMEDYRMVGNYEEIPVEGGKGVFTRRATRLGTNNWSGLIEVTAPDGSKLRRPFEHQFEVAQPNAVVSPSKMNVFYRGVPNPVEISIPGFSMDRISATIDGGGSIKRVGNAYEVLPPARSDVANVTVYAEVQGRRSQMGVRQFRVRDVPDPTANVRGLPSRGVVDKNQLATSLAMEAQMPEWFDFDLSFTVTEFKVSAVVGGFTRTQPSTSQLITEDQRRLLDGLRSGQTVTIVDIKAVGPDGRPRELADIVYRIR